MGSEKDTGRTLLRTDWTPEAPAGPHAALLLLMLMLVVLEIAGVVVGILFLKLGMVDSLKMEPLVVVSVAVVGMLLGVMGLLK